MLEGETWDRIFGDMTRPIYELGNFNVKLLKTPEELRASVKSITLHRHQNRKDGLYDDIVLHLSLDGNEFHVSFDNLVRHPMGTDRRPSFSSPHVELVCTTAEIMEEQMNTCLMRIEAKDQLDLELAAQIITSTIKSFPPSPPSAQKAWLLCRAIFFRHHLYLPNRKVEIRVSLYFAQSFTLVENPAHLRNILLQHSLPPAGILSGPASAVSMIGRLVYRPIAAMIDVLRNLVADTHDGPSVCEPDETVEADFDRMIRTAIMPLESMISSSALARVRIVRPDVCEPVT